MKRIDQRYNFDCGSSKSVLSFCNGFVLFILVSLHVMHWGSLYEKIFYIALSCGDEICPIRENLQVASARHPRSKEVKGGQDQGLERFSCRRKQ